MDTFLLLWKIIVAVLVPAIFVPALIYLERKVVAWFQIRVGPNRVGPHGFAQPFADALKLILKEDITPLNADKLVYTLAPILMLTPALMTFLVIPFGPPVPRWGTHLGILAGADLNVGILYYLALTSLGVYGIFLAGWSSNSKYPLLGSLRSSAQMLSYEISMGLSIVPVLMVTGSLRMSDIVNAQQGCWFCIPLFVAFVTYFITGIAETNRAPFDLPEAESELVAGYHTEYSSFKFAMFFMGEYANMVTVSAIATTLFLGGWGPGPFPALGWFGWLLPTIWFFLKMCIFLFIFFWLRATLPRFRYDQLMYFGWKVLLPICLANLAITAVIVVLVPPGPLHTGLLGPVTELSLTQPFVWVMLLSQLVLA
ncbi:MAG: NADH-quinone oxidoreductase subunit NuoH, partial [Chloroflexi bacterium]|nr:NADH-quinone oxidoreductase subunit NuoH [Chloroflexota bacterium]